MIKTFLRITMGIILDVIYLIIYFVSNNLKNFARLLNLLLPYAMYIIGQYMYKERGKFAVGSELFIPICVCVVIYFLHSFANKIGKGITIPVPNERFTEVDDDGEVTVENRRLQELILYMADLEDWLERKGLL